MTPPIAPEAPTIGTGDSGFRTTCSVAAASPQST